MNTNYLDINLVLYIAKKYLDIMEKEEGFYQLLLNSVNEAIIVTDLSGKITFWNKGAEELYKWKSEEVINKDILDITTSNMSRKQAEEIMTSLQNGQQWQGEFEVADKYGNVFLAQVSDTPLTNQKGELKGIIGVSSNVSEKRKAEYALERSEEKYRGIFENLTDEVHLWEIIRNSSGEIKSWKLIEANPSALKAWGKKKEDVLGKTTDEIFQYHATDQFMPIVEEIFRTKEPYHWESYFTPTGQHLSMISLAFGDYFISTGRDLTDHNKAKKEIKRLTDSLNIIINNIPVVTWLNTIHEEGYAIDFVSQNIKDLFGITAEELYENPDLWFQFINKADLGKVRSEFDAFLKGEGNWDIEYRITSQDGVEKWLYAKGEFLKSTQESSRSQVVGFLLDISEEKKAQEKLIESEKLLKKAEVLAEQGSWKWDIINDKWFFSDNWLKIHGYENLGITKEELLEIAHPDDRKAILEAFEDALYRSKAYDIEHRIIRQDNGDVRVIKASGAVHFLSSGEPELMIGIAQDITDMKRVYLDLQHAKEKAEESDRLKSTFLANMSHEIRTPLNGLLGFTELLADPETKNEERIKYVELIENSGERLLSLMNNLIDFSKIEANEMQISKSKVDLSAVFEELELLFQKQVGNNRVALVFDLTSDTRHIYTDKYFLEAIMINLVSNAIKYTDVGSIVVSANTESTHMVFSVKDTGIGIPKDRINLMFDRFIQDEGVLHRRKEGSGLGLSICKAYVEMLNGKIWAESELGKGSSFYFSLPL